MAGGKLKTLGSLGMYGDGAGLYLKVTGDGTKKIPKSWVFRYLFNGHVSKAGKPMAREMDLVSLDTWTLAEVHDRARRQSLGTIPCSRPSINA
jgi:hypothetical protein